MIRQLLRTSAALAAAAIGLSAPMIAHATDSNIGETSEVQFSSTDAADLRNKASALASPVAVFEYMRNNYDYSLYHGARSGSVNTFLGGRGNDVDLAATLIAMLRSQGIPARYVVGTVRVPATQVANWLQVEDSSLAKSLLIDQGVQNVVSSTSGSTATIDFEHVWVEALIPYGQYRGAGAQSPSCTGTTPPATCHWVPMDPSFKQYKQVSSGLDPYTTLSFDYTSYYNALKNNDSARRDKNPLEIYQEQVLNWLGTNAPGKTLDDIPDFQGIVAETDGLLPASLPYAVVGSTRSYNSVADHDAVVPTTEPKNWGKLVKFTMALSSAPTNSPTSPCSGASLSIQNGIVTLCAGGSVLLTDLATQRLTMTLEIINGQTQLVARKGGTQVGGSITLGSSSSINGWTPSKGDPLAIYVSLDGVPAATTSGVDQVISANYNGVAGGYYLVATGGETSNWSQVHRAAQQLLAANQQYSVVLTPGNPGMNGQACDPSTGLNCVPYVGSVAAGNELVNNSAAMDSLTGGLLYVAATQYYAKLKDDFGAIDQINKVKTPIAGFLGVVSSTYQPEYINGTAFAILPSGLLIDMKGITITGTWRINAPSTVSNSQFNLAGHITSSLEHETWQELTGYDAISTVRGIQMALANGATLLDLKKNQSTDTMASGYSAFGFTSGAAPSGFTYNPFTMPFGSTQPASWTNATSGAAFDLLLTQDSTATSALRQSRVNYVYAPSSGLYGWVNCVYTQANQLQGYINQGYANSNFTSTYSLCDGTAYSTSYTISQIYAGLQSNYTNTVIPTYIGQNYFNFFDRAQGFVPASYMYRTTPIASNAQFTSMVQKIRDNLYFQDLTKNWVEYVIPSQQSVGSNFKFAVDIRNVFDAPTGNQTSATFEILNDTGIAAGGGFVNPWLTVRK